ncbi:phosphotransferase [Sphingomonas sp.]|uniref:aminoglycoside phosphotransferase family protein n=1 Tax=Sphingomonas sp. TaxID=28214 RepID=UPI0025DD2D2C|nr:phosphotransferase [Sphingomonas sp.]
MIPPAAAPDFLTRCGWAGAQILPLAGDASFRRYFRIVAPGRQAVLMDAPPPHEDPRPFIRIAEHLTGLGFSAPAILGSDLDHGLVLLEDFGDARMRETVDAQPESEQEIYADVVRLLKRLHQHPAADLPPFSRKELQREAGLFAEWYCPAVSLVVDEVAYRSAWDSAFATIEDAKTVTVLRDYHAENIMLIHGRAGLSGFGLLDFQDALAGHPAYDLVSLLQDARRDVSAELEAEMRALYSDVVDRDFDAAYAILGAQRNAKILGIFTRLWKRDGKPRYLDYLPRVWAYLERDLEHPALVQVAAWFNDNVPPEKRAPAWALPTE